MKKIMIVEDDPGHLKTIIEYLVSANEHYEIISASNVACSIAEAEIPDLIIMDWDLPVMNGIEATIKLKKNEVTSAIPVIMCTGTMMTSEDLQTSFSAGAIDFIRKPADRIELTARVRSMLMLSEYFKYKNIAEHKVNDLSKEIQENEIKRLKMNLEFKNKELTAKAMFLVQKDEIIQKTIDKMREISTNILIA
jgi:DNA-binding response OmpR family regulator